MAKFVIASAQFRLGPGPDNPGSPASDIHIVGYYVSYVYRANLYIRNTPRHRTGAISEGRAKCDGTNRRGQGHCKAGAP